jgi:hypothetical protein
MKFLVSFFEFWIRYMRVDLSGSDRRMSEKLLNDTNIGTIRQESGSKTMSKGMGVKILEDSRTKAVVLYHIGDKKTSEADGFIFYSRRKDVRMTEIMADKKRCK